MRIVQIVFLLSVCGCCQPLSLAISDILETVKLSKDVVIDVTKTFKLLDEDVGRSSKENGQRVLLEEIKVCKNKIDMLSAQMGKGSHVLYAMVGFTDIQLELKLKLLEVIKNIDLIKLKFRLMGTFIESKAAYEDLTLVEFARSVVSSKNSSLQSLLDRIHVIIAPKEDENYDVDDVSSVFKILYEIMRVQGNKMFCKMQTSEEQLVLYLYNTLALTEVKGFLMMEFSYMILRLHNQGNFTKKIKAAQGRYRDRSAITLKLTIEILEWLTNELWTCDPYNQVKNETYIEITEFLQGYIEHEVDLHEGRHCREQKCPFKNTKSYNCWYSNDPTMLCSKQEQCKGTIIDCQLLTDGKVCLADAGTNRRYEYIELVLKGKVLGRKKECADYVTMQGWGVIMCEYCMCFCDEQGVNSDRYFNMRPTESKIHLNMVVTGLRFVKKNRIIHLQIQEGKLLPRAKIDVATVRWKPVEDYRIHNRRVSDGEDYHTLTWDKRGFYLDDIVTDEQELVTGVKFSFNDSSLNLQIRMTPFNFTTGTLELGKSKWKYNNLSRKDRKKLNLDNKDIPIRDPDVSLPASESGMYLEFTHTSLDMDVAQTTVPFIDAQAVASKEPVPLCGAGVMYKGSKNYGGYIYPMIRTYDYLKLFHKADDDTNFGKKFVYNK